MALKAEQYQRLALQSGIACSVCVVWYSVASVISMWWNSSSEHSQFGYEVVGVLNYITFFTLLVSMPCAIACLITAIIGRSKSKNEKTRNGET
jgi:RsiW-degrading membrane proteinase PrsW (M82 family)